MKKILVGLALLTGLCASAENYEGVRLGFKADVGLSNVIDFNCERKVGWGFGFVTEFNLTPDFYISTGFGLDKIRCKYRPDGEYMNNYYLSVPVHFGGRLRVTDDSYAFVQAGPQFSLGSFADYGLFDSGIANRPDVGVGCKAGFDTKGFIAGLYANYGLLKFAQHKIEGKSGHNLSFGFTFGYMFSLCK